MKKVLLTLLAVTMIFAACGGGGGGDSATIVGKSWESTTTDGTYLFWFRSTFSSDGSTYTELWSNDTTLTGTYSNSGSTFTVDCGVHTCVASGTSSYAFSDSNQTITLSGDLSGTLSEYSSTSDQIPWLFTLKPYGSVTGTCASSWMSAWEAVCPLESSCQLQFEKSGESTTTVTLSDYQTHSWSGTKSGSSWSATYADTGTDGSCSYSASYTVSGTLGTSTCTAYEIDYTRASGDCSDVIGTSTTCTLSFENHGCTEDEWQPAR